MALGQATRRQPGHDGALAHRQHGVARGQHLAEVRRCEDHAAASRGELTDETLDLTLGLDVDPLGRLVEQEHGDLGSQPAREEQLLLVAARELTDRTIRVARADVESVHQRAHDGVGGGAAPPHSAGAPAGAVESGEQDVVANARALDDALSAVGADVPEAGLDPVGGPTEQSASVAAFHGDPARGAEETAQDAVGAAAEEPGDRQDLAPGEADALASEERRADRPASIHARRLDVTARDVTHEAREIEGRPLDRRHGPAVAEHRAPVAQLEDLLEAVRGGGDPDPGTLPRRDRPGEPADVARLQGGGRLARVAESASDTIHEDASGVGLVDAGEDLDQRGFAGAVLADDRVDFARCELERDLVESLSGEEALAEPLGDDHRHRATRGTIILGSTTRPRSMMTSPSSITVQSRIGTS